MIIAWFLLTMIPAYTLAGWAGVACVVVYGVVGYPVGQIYLYANQGSERMSVLAPWAFLFWPIVIVIYAARLAWAHIHEIWRLWS